MEAGFERARFVRVDPRPPFLLLAGFPDEADPQVSPRQMIEIEEALLSFARAAFSRGRRVVLPDAPGVTRLLALVAAEYGRPRRSEEFEEEPPLLEIDFGRREEAEMPLGLERIGGVGRSGSADRTALLERAESRSAVVIGEPPGLAEWVGLLQERRVPLRTIRWLLTDRHLDEARAVGADPESWDVGGPLLEMISWGYGGEVREGVALAAEAVIPYPFLMQRLVELDEEEGAQLRVEAGNLAH